MANKFRSKLLYGRTGVFYDAVGIGSEAPASGLAISGGNLSVSAGNVFFDNRPIISGSMPVALLNDITGGLDLSNYYPSSNPSGFISGVDLSNYITSSQSGQFYPSSNPSGFSSQSKTYARFTALDNQPPSGSFATLDTRNSIAVLDFDSALVESSVFVSIIPEGAKLTSGLVVNLIWMASTATSGNVRWRIEFERGNTDLDANSFDTAVEANGAANGTNGITTTTSITSTNLDGLSAGNLFRLRVSRVGNDATNDTMTGDAELIAIEVRGAA